MLAEQHLYLDTSMKLKKFKAVQKEFRTTLQWKPIDHKKYCGLHIKKPRYIQNCVQTF